MILIILVVYLFIFVFLLFFFFRIHFCVFGLSFPTKGEEKSPDLLFHHYATRPLLSSIFVFFERVPLATLERCRKLARDYLSSAVVMLGTTCPSTFVCALFRNLYVESVVYRFLDSLPVREVCVDRHLQSRGGVIVWGVVSV